jgi:hypothetical protein
VATTTKELPDVVCPGRPASGATRRTGAGEEREE